KKGGNAGLRFTLHDGVVDRRSTAISWKQRAVQVEGREPRRFEYRRRQDAEGHDDDHVRLELPNLVGESRILDGLRLNDPIDAQSLCGDFYGRGRYLPATAARLVGPRNDCNGFVAAFDEPLE